MVGFFCPKRRRSVLSAVVNQLVLRITASRTSAGRALEVSFEDGFAWRGYANHEIRCLIGAAPADAPHKGAMPYCKPPVVTRECPSVSEPLGPWPGPCVGFCRNLGSSTCSKNA